MNLFTKSVLSSFIMPRGQESNLTIAQNDLEIVKSQWMRPRPSNVRSSVQAPKAKSIEKISEAIIKK